MPLKYEEDTTRAARTLERGLANDCADDIMEVLVNLGDGTCDYVELIPVLERVAQKETFYYFDDNGAGGFPRADFRHPASFEYSALKAIENIKENARFEATGKQASALKSLDNQRIKTALKNISADSSCTDKNLIPILEKIARKDIYGTYSYYSGYRQEYSLAELARLAIQKIIENCKNKEEN